MVSDDIAPAYPVVLHLPRCKVADRDRIEYLLRRFFDVVPHLMRCPALIPLVVEMRHRRQRSLERADNVAQPHLFRPENQRVPALRPSHAADEAGLAQCREQLVQIRLRDALPRRDFGALQRTLAVVVRQFYEGADAVVTLGGDTHSRMSGKLSDYINNIDRAAKTAQATPRSPPDVIPCIRVMSCSCRRLGPARRSRRRLSPRRSAAPNA